MPSPASIVAAALTAAAFFTLIGLPWARFSSLPTGAAPALGWALFCVVALPVLCVAPFSPASVGLLTLVCAAVSLAALRLAAPEPGDRLPGWAPLLAACVAVLPAIAILPVHVAGGVLLAPPVFDHAKVAIIDQITRQGMPPGNPFYGSAGHPSALAYYYLWHFGAAMLAEILGLGGWAADAAMTWFTAWASLLLVMSLAQFAGGGRRSVWIASLLVLPAGLRPLLIWLAGPRLAQTILPPSADLGGWMNQASWVPQHLASGCCVVISAFLIARLPRPDGWRAALLLPLTVAAGFESSTWVGGMTFAASAAVAGSVILARIAPGARWRFLSLAAGGALAAALLILPFVRSQLAMASAASAGVPIAVLAYRALGGSLSGVARTLVDLLAFWPLVLPFNLPAILPVGLFSGAFVLRGAPAERRLAILALAGVALACLCVTWLLRSTIENNDLGWRAPIPAILLLTAGTAAALESWTRDRLPRWAIAALCLAALGLPQAAIKLHEAVGGQRPGDAAGVAQAPALWGAVRRHTAPGERVAGNPLALGQATPWPDNIGWALLSNRPSCFSGWATAVAYAGLPRDELVRISTQFLRVFAGAAVPGDVAELAGRHDCSVAVVTPPDGAWAHDPFAASPEYRLVEANSAWRIYRRADSAQQ